MSAPALVIAPPAPLHRPIIRKQEFGRELGDSTESSRSGTTSETAAVTIYSMYGEDRGSWTSVPQVDIKIVHERPSVDKLSIASRDFKGRISPLGDHSPATRPSSQLSTGRSRSQIGVAVSDYQDPSESHRDHEMHATRRSRQFSDEQPSLSYLVPDPSIPDPPRRLKSKASSSSISSQRRPSSTADGGPISHDVPARSSMRSPSPALPSTHSSKHLLAPKAQTDASQRASAASLHPSEGADSFHVRSVYAQLEASGVRGDGWEDGVELTRARMGAPNDVAQTGDKTADITEAEARILSSVDRYGFLHTPNHDRLIMLPSSSLGKFAPYTATTSSAPPSPPNLPFLPPMEMTLAQRKTEQRRIGKWQRMLSAIRDQGSNAESWVVRPAKEAKWRERIFKGVPDRWRSAAWWTSIERYSHGTQSAVDLARQYRDAIDQPSTFDIQIDLDVPRTISGHVMFKTRYGHGQRSLFHVLHSFSQLCPECGYVQGMGPIAATMLCYFDPERTYAALVRLHGSYGMHSIFSPGFPGMLEAIYIQERIMERMLPGVYAAFKTQMISTTSYATKWYITLFANTVTFQTQLRLWDVLLLEGMDVIALTAVAIVWSLKDNLLAQNATFETILSLLSSFFVVEDEDALMQWLKRALDDRRLRSDMVNWRTEWKELVKTGKSGNALL